MLIFLKDFLIKSHSILLRLVSKSTPKTNLVAVKLNSSLKCATTFIKFQSLSHLNSLRNGMKKSKLLLKLHQLQFQKVAISKLPQLLSNNTRLVNKRRLELIQLVLKLKHTLYPQLSALNTKDLKNSFTSRIANS